MESESPIVDHNAKRNNNVKRNDRGAANTLGSKGVISNNSNYDRGENKNTGGGKKKLKPIVIALIIVISIPFIITAASMLYYFNEGAYESDYSYDTLEYADDRIVVYIDWDSDEGCGLLDAETLEEYLSDFGATICDDSMGDVGVYYVELDSSYTYEELCDICDQLEEYDGVDVAYPDWETPLDES